MLFSGLFLGIQFQKQLEVWLYMRGAWGWNSTATEPSVLPSQNQLLPLGVESSIRTKKIDKQNLPKQKSLGNVRVQITPAES